MSKQLFTTSYLAKKLNLHQGHVQRLINEHIIEAPEFQLVGAQGVRPPQHAFTEDQVARIKATFRRRRIDG